jgi:hypothetical protein
MKLAIIQKDSFNIHNNVFIDLAFSVARYALGNKSLDIEPILIPESYLDKYLVDKCFDAVFCIQCAGMKHRQRMKDLDIQIIISWDDIHWWTDDALKCRLSMFEYADKILLPYYKHFLEKPEYDNYFDKGIYFPWFAPVSCFNSKCKWKARSNKILMSGRCSPQYTFRNQLKKHCLENSKEFEFLKHPSYRTLQHEFVNQEYHKYLSTFQSAIATTADKPLDYLVLKNFEILACGCVGFLESHPNLDDLGFIPYEHYIPIDSTNYCEQLSASWDCRKIAKAGRKFVRDNHTSMNRAKEFFEILMEDL